MTEAGRIGGISPGPPNLVFHITTAALSPWPLLVQLGGEEKGPDAQVCVQGLGPWQENGKSTMGPGEKLRLKGRWREARRSLAWWGKPSGAAVRS